MQNDEVLHILIIDDDKNFTEIVKINLEGSGEYQVMMENKGILTIKTWVEGKFAKISVTDTGGGIPEDIRDRIFEPFFTTKVAGEGSGLGLDIIKKIVDKHEGNIEMETETGVGTTFTISLPV